MWTLRSIEVLKNGRKFLSVCVVLAYQNRRIAIFGARTIFFGFALILLQNRKSIFRRRFHRCGRLDRPRCSKTVENSLISVCIALAY